MTDPISRGVDVIDELCDRLSMDRGAANMARMVLVRARDEDALAGRPVEVSAAAALLVVCRQMELPYAPRDVARASAALAEYDVEETGDNSPSLETRIGRTRAKIESAVGLETRVTRPEAYLDRYVTALGLDSGVERVARQVLSHARSADPQALTGRSPSGIAAGAVYTAGLLCDDRRTQREVADAGSTSAITVGTSYRVILDAFGRDGIPFDREGGTKLNTDRIERDIEKRISESESESRSGSGSGSGSDADRSANEDADTVETTG